MADYYGISVMFQMIVAPRISPGHHLNPSEQQKQEFYEINYNRLIFRMQTLNVQMTGPSTSSASPDRSGWLIAPDNSILDHDGTRLRLANGWPRIYKGPQ